MANQPKIKAHSLTGRITYGLMQEAFKAVKRNRGAAGIDKVSIEMFAANLDQNLQALMRDLKEGSFEPLPLASALYPQERDGSSPSRHSSRSRSCGSGSPSPTSPTDL